MGLALRKERGKEGGVGRISVELERTSKKTSKKISTSPLGF